MRRIPTVGSLYPVRISKPPVPSLAPVKEHEGRSSPKRDAQPSVRTKQVKCRQGTTQAVRRVVTPQAVCSPDMTLVRTATRSTSWKPIPKHRQCEVWRVRRGDRAWHVWRENVRNLRDPFCSAKRNGGRLMQQQRSKAKGETGVGCVHSTRRTGEPSTGQG